MRFLHTADWQIGLTRRYLSPEAQPRFTQARTDVVRALGRLAQQEGCELVVVAGDVFEHDQLTAQTVRRAIDALASVPVPVYLLPGNHDHLGPLSLWQQRVVREELPEHVHVLDRPGVHEVRPGLEIVAVPWHGKHPAADLVGPVLDTLPVGPAPEGTVRIVVAHGAVDLLDPDEHQQAAIPLARLQQALDAGQVHYVALGDRHSTTRVGDDAVWYAGAPEPTDWREPMPGQVLVVDAQPGPVGARGTAQVTEHQVATWHYEQVDRRIDSDADIDALDRHLGGLTDKDRTVVRLGLRGSLGLAQHARLEDTLERHADLLGALVRPPQHNDIVVTGAGDLADLGLAGFLAGAVADIRSVAEVEPVESSLLEATPGDSELEERVYTPNLPDDDQSARDALALLYRLARGGAR